jgi:hypothetical protein
MKRLSLALGLTFILSAAVFAKANDDQEFIVKVGVQPQTTASFLDKDFDGNVGISAGFEYFKYFGNIIAAGAGAVYDLPRKFKDDDMKGSISFAPMYAGVKIRTPLEGLNNNFAFLSGRLGYGAFMYNDMDIIKSSSGGLYYGVGIGVSISYLVLEAIYSITNYSYKTESLGLSKSYNEKYSTISIYAGFKFE